MKKLLLSALFLIVSLVIYSCGGGGDDAGTSGGSGEITSGDSSSNSSSSSSNSTTTVRRNITLNASSDFTCTSNWTVRDGAWGLKAYSGTGVCNAPFPGESGTYTVTLLIQTEFDGNPPYEVAINNRVIQAGIYPLSSALGCDCPLDNWTQVCPDLNRFIECGTHTIQTGDTISFKGSDDYPCGSEHGAYAKWHNITFRRVD